MSTLSLMYWTKFTLGTWKIDTLGSVTLAGSYLQTILCETKEMLALKVLMELVPRGAWVANNPGDLGQ